jgi:hypothetical protein
MLRPRFTPQANIQANPTGWHLQIPSGENGNYQLAQLDDYVSLSRGNFPLKTPTSLSLVCRASAASLPGTWGFGFWNDPFAFSLGLQGMARRLPALPNACWFFNASPENHLSFDNQHSGSGFLAQTFRSPRIPAALLLPGVLGAPLLYAKTLSKWLRAIAGKLIREDSLQLDVDTTGWHAYELSWGSSAVSFSIDQAVVFQSPVSPRGPLGLVIWIDNQYAAWTPAGTISMGTLPLKEPAWIEVEQVQIKA